MEKRKISKLNRSVSAVGLGTWQIGADWGTVEEEVARNILQDSFDAGVTFIDTADIYGDGRSEKLIGGFLKDLGDRSSEVVVATKMGRQASQELANYNLDNFRGWIDRSRKYLGVETVDLVQLHCPPQSVYSSDLVYDALDTLVDEGHISAYGVSVHTCDQALIAMQRPNLASVQIVFNAFRLKPLEKVLPAAQAADVAIIARVPLASGLLSAKFTSESQFTADDHRNYNRNGEVFSVGETFSGVDFEDGIEAANEFASLAPSNMSSAQFALRWVVDQPGVTTVIPGARTAEQARSNAQVSQFPPLTPEQLNAVEELYNRRIRSSVHHQW